MKDNLARTTYAKKIASEIEDHYNSEKIAVLKGKKNDPENIVFAISGKWGEGKTSLLTFIENPLRKKGYGIVKFNPWKYSQDDIALKRAFLCAIKKQLPSTVNLDDLYYDRTKTIINIGSRSVLHLVSSILGVAIFIFLFLPLILKTNIHEWSAIILKLMDRFIRFPLTVPTITVLMLPAVAKVITLNRRSTNVSTAEEFENKFNELLKGKEKIVIFIDDLDRCNPKTVKVVLDSLKTFFQHPECSYIITGDHTVIERYAADELEFPDETTQEEKLQEGRRFLKKLFDVYWRLPLPTPYQFSIFVDDEIKNSRIKFNQNQSDNLRSFLINDDLFERNPRHVKRFLTKLRFALESVNLQKEENNRLKKENDFANDSQAALEDILENPDLLAKILLIEEFFYPLYEKLTLHPEELITHEKILRNSTDIGGLAVKGKTVLSILSPQNQNTEQLARYVSFVNKAPQFTDTENSTNHEVSCYFLTSGSTGLPSLLGPDEANFEQYLKGGQLVDKLGAVLLVDKKDKKESFSIKALEIFDKSTEPIEKLNIIKDSLKLTLNIDEWANKIPQWKDKIFTLPEDQQNSVSQDFWKVVIKKYPDLLDVVKAENPSYFESIWDVVNAPDFNESIPELTMIVKEMISATPLNLRGVEIYLGKFNPEELKIQLEEVLSNPDSCKTYLEHLITIGYPNGKISEIIISKLTHYLLDPDQLNWMIVNQEFLKSINLFETSRKNLIDGISSAKQLIDIIDQQDGLNLTDDEKKQIINRVPKLITKSSDIQFLNNGNIQLLLDKQLKIKIFEHLKNVLKDSGESLEKRNETAQSMLKNYTIWNDVETNDIYEILKDVKKIKLGKISDLKNKPREIIESWGYDKSDNTDSSLSASQDTEIPGTLSG